MRDSIAATGRETGPPVRRSVGDVKPPVVDVDDSMPGTVRKLHWHPVLRPRHSSICAAIPAAGSAPVSLLYLLGG